MIAIAAVLIHVAVPKVDRALTGLRVRSSSDDVCLRAGWESTRPQGQR
jgi:Tfp pilus assembly protein FimT